MNVDLQKNIINNLQNFAKKNKLVTEMAYYVINELNLDANSRLIVAAYFKDAFTLELKEISQIGAWNFFEGGTWDDEKIEEVLKPLIKKSKE